MMQHSCKILPGKEKNRFEFHVFRVLVIYRILCNADSNLGWSLTSHKRCKTLKSPYLA